MNPTPARAILREELWNGEVIAVALAIVLIVVARLLLPAHERRLTRQPTVFVVLHVVLITILRLWPGETPLHHGAFVAAIVLLLAGLGRAAVVLVMDVILGRRMRTPLPKIIRDLSQGVVYSLLGLGALHAGGIDLGSILTTSAVLTAVIGLSLQETLGNLFAGLAIQLQHPFDVGDWIQFDPDPTHVGKVLEISWRATKVLTADDVEVIVPNGALGKAPISNFSKPKPQSRRTVFVTLPASVPPRRAHQLVVGAISGAWGVLDSPPVVVMTSDFAESGVQYCARFWTDQFHERDVVDAGVRDRIWYALAREGIPLATPTREVFVHEHGEEAHAKAERETAAMRLAALRGVDFLAVLPEESLVRLAGAARERLYAPDETILKKGDPSNELFVIKSGAVRIVIPAVAGDAPEEVARLGAGEFFGEMALMTGEPRNATVISNQDSQLFAIGSDDVKSILESHPQLAETVSRVLAERQAMLEEREGSPASHKPEDVAARTSKILGRVRRFFSL